LRLLWAGVRGIPPVTGQMAAWVAPPEVDASIWEMSTALVKGGGLVALANEQLMDQKAFREHTSRHAVETITATPTLLGHLRLEVYPSQLSVVSAGEPLTAELAVGLTGAGHALMNAYGPAEAAVCATVGPVPSGQQLRTRAGVPVGAMLPGLVAEMRGVFSTSDVVELGLAGAKLSRGYLGNPRETARRFVPSSVVPGARCYLTGDVFHSPDADGALVFRGRTDRQVKVRGFRVEPEGIEARLRSVGYIVVVVLECDEIVVVREAVTPQAVAPTPPADVAKMTAALVGTLPASVLPRHWLDVNPLPLTAWRKVDFGRVSALAAMALDRVRESQRSQQVGAQPGETLRNVVREVWVQHLNREVLDDYVSFFALGGHSLLATRVIAAIRQETSRPLSIREFFRHPTVAELADLLSHEEIIDD
jgi:acyl-coenzyme A synthetase/AMP-(fatty) acid ligase